MYPFAMYPYAIIALDLANERAREAAHDRLVAEAARRAPGPELASAASPGQWPRARQPGQRRRRSPARRMRRRRPRTEPGSDGVGSRRDCRRADPGDGRRLLGSRPDRSLHGGRGSTPHPPCLHVRDLVGAGVPRRDARVGARRDGVGRGPAPGLRRSSTTASSGTATGTGPRGTRGSPSAASSPAPQRRPPGAPTASTCGRRAATAPPGTAGGTAPAGWTGSGWPSAPVSASTTGRGRGRRTGSRRCPGRGARRRTGGPAGT